MFSLTSPHPRHRPSPHLRRQSHLHLRKRWSSPFSEQACITNKYNMCKFRSWSPVINCSGCSAYIYAPHLRTVSPKFLGKSKQDCVEIAQPEKSFHVAAFHWRENHLLKAIIWFVLTPFEMTFSFALWLQRDSDKSNKIFSLKLTLSSSSS